MWIITRWVGDDKPPKPQDATMDDVTNRGLKLKETFQKLKETEDQLAHYQRQYAEEKTHHEQTRANLNNMLQRAYADHASREQGRVEYYEEKFNTLSRGNTSLRDELARTRQELQTSRAFLSIEASDDGKTLQDFTIDLNRQINEFAYLVVNTIPQSVLNEPFRLSQDNPVPKTTAQLFFSRAAEASLRIDEVVEYAVQHETCKFIKETTFDTFILGAHPTKNDILHRVYAKVYRKNIQAHSARWRSITYASNRLPLEESTFSNYGDALLRHILDNVGAISIDIPHIHGDVLQKVFDKAVQLMETAIMLQDKAKAVYLSYDYKPFLVEPGCQFDSRIMRFGGGSKRLDVNRNEVVLGLGFGLKACQSVAGEDGNIQRNEVFVLPVSVLTADWVEVA